MCPDRENLLKEIMAIDFFLYDLALYLDTHSNDRRALLTFNDYLKRVKMMKENYELAYGPLTYDRKTNNINWQWVDSPWPWEYSYN